MPTSTNPAYSVTAAQFMDSAARELGAISFNESLETAEAAEMLARFNGMLAKWAVEMNLFREETSTVTITGGTGAATLPVLVQSVRSARHVVSATQMRQLQPWNRDQFFALPHRSQEGDTPVAFYTSKVADQLEFYIWPVPADDVDIELDFNRAFYFIESSAQTVDLPKEWYEAALYGLAARSANIFGATRINPQAIARIDNQAKVTYEAMLDADRPDSYFFEYDTPVRLDR